MKRFKQIAFAAIAACGLTVTAHAQMESAALVDALLQKGVLNTQEAEDIKSDLAKEYKSTAGGKLDINKSVKKLKLYGDFRGRYEYRRDERNNSIANGSNRDRWRARYRLRVGSEYTMSDGFKVGFELGTGSVNDQRSNNQTFSQGFAFDTIQVTKAYGSVDLVKYFDTDLYLDEIEVTFGKFKNPLKKTSMTWDSDITPAGAYQKFSKKFDVDGTALTPFFLVGQWIEKDATTGATTDAIWVVPIQAGVDVKFENKDKMSFAATYYSWLGDNSRDAITDGPPNRGGAPDGTSTAAPAVPPGNPNNGLTSFENYNVFTAYADYTFAKTWSKDVPLKLYSELIYNPNASTANMGANFGAKLGQTKKRGQWAIGAEFRYLEQYAWYDGWTDSDFSAGSVNRWGGIFKAEYALTDFAALSVTYFKTDVIRKNTVASRAPGGSNGLETDRLQLDVMIKF